MSLASDKLCSAYVVPNIRRELLRDKHHDCFRVSDACLEIFPSQSPGPQLALNFVGHPHVHLKRCASVEGALQGECVEVRAVVILRFSVKLLFERVDVVFVLAILEVLLQIFLAAYSRALLLCLRKSDVAIVWVSDDGVLQLVKVRDHRAIICLDCDGRHEINRTDLILVRLIQQVILALDRSCVLRIGKEGKHRDYHIERDADVSADAETAAEGGPERLTLLVGHLRRGAQTVIVMEEFLHHVTRLVLY